MSFDEAAGIPVVAETAWRAVVSTGEVKKGQKVLIHGAAGGVGSSAVQIAKARGAYVIGTASARNHAFLKSLGVDETVDYTATRFEDKVKDVDVAINTADADTNARSIGVVKKGGILVSVVGAPDAAACSKAGIRCAITGPVTGQMLPNVVELANAGQFKVSVDQRLPLAEAGKAWEDNRTGHTAARSCSRSPPRRLDRLVSVDCLRRCQHRTQEPPGRPRWPGPPPGCGPTPAGKADFAATA